MRKLVTGAVLVSLLCAVIFISKKNHEYYIEHYRKSKPS